VSMVLSRDRLLKFELPVAEAFRAAFHSDVVTDIVLIGGLLGLVAVWNALFFAATRVLYALGRARLLHPALGSLGADGSAPTIAIAWVTAFSIAGLFLGKGALLPVVNVTSTLFSLMYVIVSLGVLRHRRMATAPATSYRVPGGKLLVWAAVLFSFYLLVLSLVQQWMDAGRRLPTEWLLMVGFGSVSWVLWFTLRRSRSSLSSEARRRIILT
jgi:basic amino acid/polyamine antiporter, APA family